MKEKVIDRNLSKSFTDGKDVFLVATVLFDRSTSRLIAPFAIITLFSREEVTL